MSISERTLKDIEQDIKKYYPCITSMTVDKVYEDHKVVFDCEVNMKALSEKDGKPRLLPLGYKWMERALVSEGDTICIPQVSDMLLKDVAESIHVFNISSSPRHEVFFDFYRNTEEYRKQFSPEEIEGKYFVALYDGNVLTVDECQEAILKCVDISNDWSVYLVPMSISGLYNEDGTPNYEKSHCSVI